MVKLIVVAVDIVVVRKLALSVVVYMKSLGSVVVVAVAAAAAVIAVVVAVVVVVVIAVVVVVVVAVVARYALGIYTVFCILRLLPSPCPRPRPRHLAVYLVPFTLRLRLTTLILASRFRLRFRLSIVDCGKYGRGQGDSVETRSVLDATRRADVARAMSDG